MRRLCKMIFLPRKRSRSHRAARQGLLHPRSVSLSVRPRGPQSLAISWMSYLKPLPRMLSRLLRRFALSSVSSERSADLFQDLLFVNRHLSGGFFVRGRKSTKSVLDLFCLVRYQLVCKTKQRAPVRKWAAPALSCCIPGFIAQHTKAH